MLTQCSARQWQRARQRESLVVAVLARDGPIAANLAAVAGEQGVSIEIELGSGARVRIDAAASAQQISAVIAALR